MTTKLAVQEEPAIYKVLSGLANTIPLAQAAELNPRRLSVPPGDADLVSFVPMRAVSEESGHIDSRNLRHWSEVKKGYTAFQDADVIFAKITPCMENGKFAVASGLHNGRGAGSTEFHVFRPKPGLLPRYLLHFLFTPTVHRAAKRNMKGAAGQLRVPIQFFEGLRIPLPATEVQQRIVDYLDEQFSRLDSSVAALHRVQANLKRYRASVLKSACEGRLVPTEAELARQEGRDYKTGAQLLQGSIAERRARWGGRGKYKEPLGPESTTLPTLPTGWCYGTLDQLTSHLTSGSRDWSPFYDRGSSVFLMAQNIRMGALDLTMKQRVDPPTADASRARSQVEVDDLLVTIVGANAGEICRVPEPLPEHYVCQSVALIRPVQSETSKYLEAFLVAPKNGQKQFELLMYGQGRPHLSFDQLRATVVPLPPLSEQHRIVAEADRRLSLIRAAEAQVTANLARGKRLRQSILQTAFAAPASAGQ